jgi:phosphatidylinositol phospholipase C gamma-1
MNLSVFQLRMKALYDYLGGRSDELSFVKHAIISNINKQDGGWWRGDHGGKTDCWFPCNYVEELEEQEVGQDDSESSPLGSLQKGTIDLTGCSLDRILRGTTNSNDKFIFRIVSPNQSLMEIGCDTKEDMDDWMSSIRKCTDKAEAKLKDDRNMERNLRIAKVFSDLIVYCRTATFNPVNITGNHLEMSSFAETKMEKYLLKEKADLIIGYNRKQFSRVYPKGARIESSNYDPNPFWNLGCHFLALNYQTPDRSMMLNQGLFRGNGHCGYVLQHEHMRNEDYNPYDKLTIPPRIEPVTVSLTIIGARHLTKVTRGISSPFVEIEIIGADYDNNKYKTSTIQDNGFNPCWNETCDFDISNPDQVMVRLTLQDEDMFSDPNFLGQATYPLHQMKPGYRAIPLHNGMTEPLELCALLVHLELRNPNDDGHDLYASIVELRDRSQEIQSAIDEREKKGDMLGMEKMQDELTETEGRLLAKNEERRKVKLEHKSHAAEASRPVPPPRDDI